MDDHIWKTSGTIHDLLANLERLTKTKRRKRMLFGAACYRTIWHLLTDEDSRNAIEEAERFADVLLPRNGLKGVRAGAKRHVQRSDTTPAQFAAYAVTAESVSMGWIAYLTRTASNATTEGNASTQQVLCNLLRDVFGNPFRPVAFDPRLRSANAVALARTAYDTRDFSLMPILADALEEAGCDNTDVLTHCRQPDAVHVRGCWVVDGVLGLA